MLKHKRKLFYCQGGQTLTQASQRGSGVFILGNIKHPTEDSCGQLWLNMLVLDQMAYRANVILRLNGTSLGLLRI